MNKKEFSTFSMALKTYFPRDNVLPNEYAMELWYRELQDIPFPIAEASLREYVHTQKFAPSIAEIREMASTVRHGNLPDWGDGWEQVLMAIRRFGVYRIDDAMGSMDEITKTCVERLGFRNICMSDNIAVDRANFRMIYEQLTERKKKEQQLSLPLKQVIDGIRKLEGVQDESNTLLETNKNN